MQEPLMMHINYTVYLQDDHLILVDRRFLPRKIIRYTCQKYEDVARGIEDMVVQGAGDIAITAGYGLYMALRDIEDQPGTTVQEGKIYALKVKERLVATRPTGFHLKALLNKVLEGIEWESGDWSQQVLRMIENAITKQQLRSELTGNWAATLLEDGDTILTHCFPGAAILYMLKKAREEGKKVKVIASETRPYLQGARLTAWSTSELGIPTTLITDNMAAYCMSQGMITKVFTAADRIAMDGTVANKVGTFQLALAAAHHKIPFYILGYGGPDSRCALGQDIPVEVRDPIEVLTFQEQKITGDKVEGFYPAFDLTPPYLIAGVITDRGIISPDSVAKYWSLPKVNVVAET